MSTTRWMDKIKERMAQGAVRQGPATFEVRVVGQAGHTLIPEIGDMVPGDFTGSGGIGFGVLDVVRLEAGLEPGQAGWTGRVAPLFADPGSPRVAPAVAPVDASGLDPQSRAD